MLAILLAIAFAPCETAPVVDGAIAAHEYDRGTAIAMPGGTAFIAADSTTFYFAWRSAARNNDPGGGMVANFKKRDDPLVCADDVVELILENPENKDAFHISINAIANVFDRGRRAGSNWDNAWNCAGLKVESVARSGVWELEASIPLETLGVTAGRLRANILRETPGERPWAFARGSDWFDGEKFELDWRNDVPCIHVTALGDPASGVWRPEIACTWAPSGAKARATILMDELDRDGRTVTNVMRRMKFLTPGVSLKGRFDTFARANYRLAFEAMNPADKKVTYGYSLTANRGAKVGGILPYAEFDLGTKACGTCFYYPGQGRARFNLVPNGTFASASVTVNGVTRPLAETKGGVWTAIVDVPTVIGSHPVSFAVDGQAFENALQLEVKSFGWERNDIGKERIVIPPFEPIRASGASVDILLRRYGFNGAGLLKSVTAKGRELLADEVHFEVVPADQSGKRRLAASGEVRIQSSSDGYEATIGGAATADGLGLKSHVRLEYDGFVWNEVMVERPATVERLTLVVPLKDDEAPLYHVVAADTIRHNPTGCVPSGDGLVFDSSTLFRKPESAEDLYAYNAVPYVWLGAEERGLCWFVNDTKGLSLDPKKGAVRLVRKDGVLRLECDLVSRRTKLAAGHRFTFGLQATPVKTKDRALTRHFQTGAASAPGDMVPRVGIPWRETSFSNHWARVPWQGDWSKFDALTQRPGIYPFKYSDPTLTWKDDEAVRHYRSEWVSRVTGYEGAVRTFLVPSSIDYVLYRFKEWMAHGLKGLYFDDMYLIPCRNADTSGGSFGILEMRELVKRAAVMQHVAGLSPRLLQVHMTNALIVPSFAFATSLLTWEDHYGEEPFPQKFPVDYVRAESMGTQVGCEGIALDGIRRKATPEAEWKRDGRLAKLTRSQLATLLPAGMSVWYRSKQSVDLNELFAAYGEVATMRPWEEDCTFVPFWQHPLDVPDGVIAGLYRRGGERLAVFGNQTGETKTFACEGRTVELAPWDYAFERFSGKEPAEAPFRWGRKIVDVELKDGPVAFDVPRDGWVWFGFDRDHFGAEARLDGSAAVTLIGREGEPPETMRYLEKGPHRLDVSGSPKSGRLAIRLVPRIVFTDEKALARELTDLSAETYGWEFVRRWLLPVFNEYDGTGIGVFADGELRLRGRRPSAGPAEGLELPGTDGCAAAISKLRSLAEGGGERPDCIILGRLTAPEGDWRRLARALHHYCLEGRTDALPPSVESTYEKNCLKALSQERDDPEINRRFQAQGRGKICEKEREGLKDITQTRPDFLCYVPEQTFYRGGPKRDPAKRGDSYNDHFQVLNDDARGLLYAFWTQATKEAAPDQHIVFSKSADRGRTWTHPVLLAGSEIRNDPKPLASWQQPMLAKTGRLYCLWNQQTTKYLPHRGEIYGRYSDDGGESWSEPKKVKFPHRASYDNPDPSVPPSWCNWQRPLRLGKDGRFLVASSRNGRLPGADRNQTAIEVWRFENIDADPEVEDIVISAFMRDERSISIPQLVDEGVRVFTPNGKVKTTFVEEGGMVRLPDGRLFMLCRSSAGYPVWSVSADGGENWSRPRILRDRDGGRPILHPTSPCPIYDVGGPEAGSGEYAAFVHGTFDFSAERSLQRRGPLYRLRGRFDAKAEQPIAFDYENRELWAPGIAGQSWYASCCRVGDRTVMWYNDRKYFLLGRFLDD